jgi:hypothetical protein
VLKLLGQDIGTRPLLTLGMLCMMSSLQFLTTGVLAELLIRIYYGGRYAQPYHVRQELVSPALTDSSAGTAAPSWSRAGVAAQPGGAMHLPASHEHV